MSPLPALARRKLQLDGEWGLLELSGFGRQYIQIYSLFYALDFLANDEDAILEGRVERAFRSFPWKGGWSAVDFYDSLRFAIPKKERPRITEIQYASPGFIELELAGRVGLEIAGAVLLVAKAINETNSAYRNIQKGFTDHKLNKINLRSAELELNKAQDEFIDSAFKQISAVVGSEKAEAILVQSPNKAVAVKIMLSLYRRIRDLAKLENLGQIKF